MRQGSVRAVAVALWALVPLAGCALLSPIAPPAERVPRPNPATKVTGSTGRASAGRPAAIAVYATGAHREAAGNVLVLLYALHGRPDPDDPPAVLDIVDRHFEPAVLAVHVGDSVRIENLDGVPHDVYSFSKVRPLSLHLAAGARGMNVRFPRAGVVTVGCKIYNDMRGYIYVTDAAYFGRTDGNGFLRLSGLAPGTYRADVWRADRPGTVPRGFPRTIKLEPGAEDAMPVRFRAAPSRAQATMNRHDHRHDRAE